ncbi:CRN domain-containing protein-containing protein [Thraustotheca clavata]|uniref:CRN domain-containing protein-containing protein n=1 Tax=Thraustotheca clavata TaxID=74557 RepID=A0A1V9YTU7_9STRA|nr:CRN domain-containing protein-containing protein [Thraustotheca clavata]
MKQKWYELVSSSVAEFGNNKDNVLNVQVPQCIDNRPHYFIIIIGVFFEPTLAVTCDHNLMEEIILLLAILIGILQFSNCLFLHGNDLVLASFQLGIQNNLGLTKAFCNTVSKEHAMYLCPTFAGDSGAAIVLLLIIKHRLTDVEQYLDNIGQAEGCSALLVK